MLSYGRVNNAIKRPDIRRIHKIEEEDKGIRRLYDRITEYLANLFASGGLTEEQATQAAGMMYILSDVERTETLCMEATAALNDSIMEKRRFSQEAVNDLNKTLDLIEEMFREAMVAIKMGNTEDAISIFEKKDKVLELTINMRKNHLKRVNSGDCEAELGSEFTTILHSFERIGNAAANIADAAAREVNFKSFFSEKGLEEQTVVS